MQSLIHPFVTVYTDSGPICPNMLRGGHPDEANMEPVEVMPPPGWEAEMELWDFQRAEKTVDDSHASAVAQAYALVKRRLGAVTMHAERVRSDVFGDCDVVGPDGGVATTFSHRVYLFARNTVNLIGSGQGESYDAAARAAVANVAQRAAKVA